MLGIEVGFNWSLIFIFAYVAWTLATAYLPDAAPGHGVVVYWVAAAIGAALFYGSLLAHELSHAVVARSHGVKVAGITLWLFGGVSRLEGEPTSARSEALIAGVGPLTSFAVAVVALAFFFLTSWSDLVSTLFAYLAVSNLLLGVFNLLPIPPLDGSALLERMLPARWLPGWYKFRPYGILLIFVLVFMTGAIGRLLDPLRDRLFEWVFR